MFIYYESQFINLTMIMRAHILILLAELSFTFHDAELISRILMRVIYNTIPSYREYTLVKFLNRVLST